LRLSCRAGCVTLDHVHAAVPAVDWLKQGIVCVALPALSCRAVCCAVSCCVLCAQLLADSEDVTCLDITGGAPELNSQFRLVLGLIVKF
jgi:hypothetical protein